MSADAAVADYYESLRRGEPLYPFFVESPETYKAAISTTYRGYDAVAEALREQTRTTTDWVVDSRALSVVERDGWAAFDDDVTLAWTAVGGGGTDGGGETDGDGGVRHEYETRWSGSLEERDGEWLFLELHVSTARDI